MKSILKIRIFKPNLLKKLAINFNRQYRFATLIQWCHTRKSVHGTRCLLYRDSIAFLFSCPSALLPPSISIKILRPKEICIPQNDHKVVHNNISPLFLSIMSSFWLIKRFRHPQLKAKVKNRERRRRNPFHVPLVLTLRWGQNRCIVLMHIMFSNYLLYSYKPVRKTKFIIS